MGGRVAQTLCFGEARNFGIVVFRNDQGFAKQQSGRSHLEKE